MNYSVNTTQTISTDQVIVMADATPNPVVKATKSRYAQRADESYSAWQTRTSALRAYMTEKKRAARMAEKTAVYHTAASAMASTSVKVASDGMVTVDDTRLVRRYTDHTGLEHTIEQSQAIDREHAVMLAMDAVGVTATRTREEMFASLTTKYKAFSAPLNVRKRAGDISGTKLDRMLRDLRVYGSMATLNMKRSGVVTRFVRNVETNGSYRTVTMEPLSTLEPMTGYAYDPIREAVNASSARVPHTPNAGASSMEVYTKSELMEIRKVRPEGGDARLSSLWVADEICGVPCKVNTVSGSVLFGRVKTVPVLPETSDKHEITAREIKAEVIKANAKKRADSEYHVQPGDSVVIDKGYRLEHYRTEKIDCKANVRPGTECAKCGNEHPPIYSRIVKLHVTAQVERKSGTVGLPYLADTGKVVESLLDCVTGHNNGTFVTREDAVNLQGKDCLGNDPRIRYNGVAEHTSYASWDVQRTPDGKLYSPLTDGARSSRLVAEPVKTVSHPFAPNALVLRTKQGYEYTPISVRAGIVTVACEPNTYDRKGFGVSVKRMAAPKLNLLTFAHAAC